MNSRSTQTNEAGFFTRYYSYVVWPYIFIHGTEGDGGEGSFTRRQVDFNPIENLYLVPLNLTLTPLIRIGILIFSLIIGALGVCIAALCLNPPAILKQALNLTVVTTLAALTTAYDIVTSFAAAPFYAFVALQERFSNKNETKSLPRGTSSHGIIIRSTSSISQYTEHRFQNGSKILTGNNAINPAQQNPVNDIYIKSDNSSKKETPINYKKHP